MLNTFAQIIKDEPTTLLLLREGELVEAELLEKGPKSAFFDLGKFGTGIIAGSELLNARDIIKSLNIGDKISAKTVSLDNGEGYVELSLAAASKQKNWSFVRDAKESGESIKVRITGANSGGLMAEISNLKAFLPVSQLSTDHYPRVEDNDKAKILSELKKFVGEEFSVIVIDANLKTNKLIISERETSDQGVKELLANYEVGQVIDGIVSGVANFGVFVRFVDNPKIEALVHISELDHRLIDNPKEVVQVNDPIKAKIIDIKEGRVTLSVKALKPNPWDTVSDRYSVGQEVKGTVSKFNPFGAFVNLDKDIQGLIHVSEFGSLDEMKNVIKVGDSYKFTISLLKPEEKRLILKLVK